MKNLGRTLSLSVILLLTAPSLVPVAAAEPPATYEADWEGRTIVERTDPLERFVALPAADPDGDGFVALDALPAPPAGGGLVGPTDASINPAIDDVLRRRGATRQSIVDEMAAFAAQDPAVASSVAQATPLILAGQYFEASSALSLGDLGIRYMCGTNQNGWVNYVMFTWYVGVPYPAQCNNAGGYDLVFDAHPVTAAVSGTDLNDVWLETTIETTDLSYTGNFLGAAYKSHVLTFKTRPPTLVDLRLAITGLVASTTTVDATLYVPYRFFSGDVISYNYGYWAFEGTTISLDMGRDEANMRITAQVSLSDGFAATIRLSDPSLYTRLRGSVPITGGRSVSLEATGLPSAFKVATRSRWSWDGGDYYLVDLENPDGVSMPYLELRGTFHDGGAQFSFQFVGFPAYNTLRISPGNGGTGCGTETTFSIDLSKRYSWTPGRYRSILVTGHTCDKDMQITASNLHRAHIVSAKKDKWENDNEVLFMTGATANVMWDSYLNIDVNVPWSPDLATRLRYDTGTRAWWGDTVGWSWTTGTLDRGYYLLDDGWFVNAYFWNIADDQLWQETCVFRYADGRCA